MTSFSHLGLSAPLLAAVEKSGYATPYPIQIAAIPAILAGKDILGIAQTGSGKTASFVLPILQILQQKNVLRNRYIKALVLVPTRELAVQVGAVFKLFGDGLPNPVKALSVFGGVSINPQMMQLQGVAILVATPGRLLDLVDNNALQLSETSILVFTSSVHKADGVVHKLKINGIAALALHSQKSQAARTDALRYTGIGGHGFGLSRS